MTFFPGGGVGGSFGVRSLRVLPVPGWVFSSYSGFLPQSKNRHVRLTGDSKVALSVTD